MGSASRGSVDRLTRELHDAAASAGGRRYVAPAQFPVGILVEAAILGCCTEVEFDGVPALTHLPRCGPEPHGELIAPDVPAGERLLLQFGGHSKGAPFFESWGRVVRSDPSGPLTATIETLALEIPSLSTHDLPAVRAAAESWLGRLVAWIEALSKQPVRLGFDTSGTHPAVGQNWFDITSDPVPCGIGPIALTGSMSSARLTMTDWSKACTHASGAVTPPLAHTILADARDALARGDDRRAVIDATTAVEIAVNVALRAVLSTTTPAASSKS